MANKLPTALGPMAYEKSAGNWRSPNIGGGLVWNDQYGWQRKQDIGKTGLTANMGEDWRKYFPGSRTDQELKQMGLFNKKRGNKLFESFKQPGGYYDYSSWNKNWKPTTQQTQQFNPMASLFGSGGGGGAGSGLQGSTNIGSILQALMSLLGGGQ